MADLSTRSQDRTHPWAEPAEVAIPVQLVTVGDPGPAVVPEGFYDSTGVGAGDPGAVMALSLPDGVRLVSFKARGLRAGADTALTMSVSRVSFADPAEPTEVLGTVAVSGSGMSRPFDVVVPVDPPFARVDNGRFRYVFHIRRTGPPGESPLVGLAAFQVVHAAW